MGLEGWYHSRKLWDMWIVAIDAMVPYSWATGEIPISIHAAVSTVLVIAGLLAVTLGAKCHDVGVSDCRAIGQMKGVGILRIVACIASQIAMIKRQVLVKVFQLRSMTSLQIGLAHAMAGRTSNMARSPLRIGLR